jgi:hypothetical protein
MMILCVEKTVSPHIILTSLYRGERKELAVSVITEVTW